MASVSTTEAHAATYAFLASLYGEDVLEMWQQLKEEMQFECEKTFVMWLVNTGYQEFHRSQHESDYFSVQSQEAQLPPTTDTRKRKRGGVAGGGGQEQVYTSAGYETYDEGELSEKTPVDVGGCEFDGADYNTPATATDWAASCAAESDSCSMRRENGTSFSTTPHSSHTPTGVKSETPSLCVALRPSQQEVVVSLKKYQCEYCEYSSPQAGNLRQHVRIHTDERPFPCTYCGQRFRTQSHRSRHERCVHHGTKRYRCNLCDFSGSRKEQLEKHLAIRHNNEPAGDVRHSEQVAMSSDVRHSEQVAMSTDGTHLSESMPTDVRHGSDQVTASDMGL